MKINEFKAWLDGYSEAIHGMPNEQQWSRIKDQIEQVVDTMQIASPWTIPPVTCLPRIPIPYIRPMTTTLTDWPYTATSGLS